jgi:hypothetical protein
MSDRPTVMRLNGMRWKIRFMSKAALFEDSGDSLLGQSKITDTEIQVREGMPPDRERFILWHEVFHAVEKDAGIDLPEEHVRALAAGLFAALRDNPAMTAWMLEEPV